MNEVAMKISQDMQEAGLKQKQAIAIANAMAEAVHKSREGLATEEGVRAEIAELKTYVAERVVRMMFVMGTLYLGSVTILGMILS